MSDAARQNEERIKKAIVDELNTQLLDQVIAETKQTIKTNKDYPLTKEKIIPTSSLITEPFSLTAPAKIANSRSSSAIRSKGEWRPKGFSGRCADI